MSQVALTNWSHSSPGPVVVVLDTVEVVGGGEVVVKS